MASTEKPLEPLASHGTQEFKALVLEQLGMVVARQTPGLTIYRNERGGFLRAYGRRGLYEFGIADYAIDHPFAIAFDSPNHLLRFGAMYDGETRFQMQGTEADAFRPSVFVTHEYDLRGVQRWETGQHYCGAEFTVYPAFLEELEQRFEGCDLQELCARLPANRTYRYLPVDLIAVLQRAVEADAAGHLGAPAVEAAVLQSLDLLLEATEPGSASPLAVTAQRSHAPIGSGRSVVLTESDCHLIERAHAILTRDYAQPPTIEQLSQELALSPQKLKAGFRHTYHTTIGAYTTALRMDQAALLLCTTDESVGAIARRMGYAHPSNFIKAFERTYSCTPRAYRLRESTAARPEAHRSRGF